MERLLRTLFAARGLILAGTLMLAAIGGYLNRGSAVTVAKVQSVAHATTCRRIEEAWYNYLPLTYLVKDWGMSQYRCGSPATQVVPLPPTNQVVQAVTCRTQGTGFVTYVPLTYLVKEWGTSQSDRHLEIRKEMR
jgi:hypothetical protein